MWLTLATGSKSKKVHKRKVEWKKRTRKKASLWLVNRINKKLGGIGGGCACVCVDRGDEMWKREEESKDRRANVSSCINAFEKRHQPKRDDKWPKADNKRKCCIVNKNWHRMKRCAVSTKKTFFWWDQRMKQSCVAGLRGRFRLVYRDVVWNMRTIRLGADGINQSRRVDFVQRFSILIQIVGIGGHLPLLSRQLDWNQWKVGVGLTKVLHSLHGDWIVVQGQRTRCGHVHLYRLGRTSGRLTGSSRCVRLFSLAWRRVGVNQSVTSCFCGEK